MEIQFPSRMATFFPRVLLRAILWASSWRHVVQGIPSAVWIALCCMHLLDATARVCSFLWIPSYTPYENLAAFSSWCFLLCTLPGLGEVRFFFLSPEQASWPQSVPSALPWCSALWGYGIRSACYVPVLSVSPCRVPGCVGLAVGTSVKRTSLSAASSEHPCWLTVHWNHRIS